MKTQIEIISLMEKYGLTLRNLPKKVVEHRTFRPDSLEEVIEIIVGNTSQQNFDKMKEKGRYSDCRFSNGFIVRKFNRIERICEGGWLVKIDRGTGSMQRWDRKHGDFYGKTAEEAIILAVKYIEKREKETEQIKNIVGL
ncbi:MAG: hypothetical protein IKU16_09490 [Muribaculaceae bacterium]|nr:hypothetical protein [Muribaculaceae bacterium]MBR4887484.1 hypothetical protein [Muribaculaceae bacterium]